MSGTAIDDERFQYRDGEVAQVSAITATLTTSGTVKSRGLPYTDTYIYGPIGEPLEFLRQQGGVTNRYWYVLDGQGSVVAVTDASGKVVDRYNYDSWGEQIGRYPETVPQPLRYDGYWYDSEVQWYWLNVRYYNPEDLRFLQPDPTEQDGVCTHVYVGDDPVDFYDPTGFCKIEVRFKKVVGSERITKGNIPFVGDLTAYHAYIITQDAQSGTYYFRSGPECGGAGSGSGSSNSGHRNYGSSNSGNCNVGSSNSGNNNVGSSNGGAHHRGGSGSGGGLFGYIYAQGDFTRRHRRTTQPTPSLSCQLSTTRRYVRITMASSLPSCNA